MACAMFLAYAQVLRQPMLYCFMSAADRACSPCGAAPASQGALQQLPVGGAAAPAAAASGRGLLQELPWLELLLTPAGHMHVTMSGGVQRR
jgi:hypothetical protein